MVAVGGVCVSTVCCVAGGSDQPADGEQQVGHAEQKQRLQLNTQIKQNDVHVTLSSHYETETIKD